MLQSEKIISKKCKCGCGQSFPANTDHFHVRKVNRDGLAGISKECLSRINKKKYQINKERKKIGYYKEYLCKGYPDYIYC